MYSDTVPAEIAPRNELELQLAMVWCRLNTWTHPVSGIRMTLKERGLMHDIDIKVIANLVDPGVLQYVWMHDELIPWHAPMLGSTKSDRDEQ